MDCRVYKLVVSFTQPDNILWLRIIRMVSLTNFFTIAYLATFSYWVSVSSLLLNRYVSPSLFRVSVSPSSPSLTSIFNILIRHTIIVTNPLPYCKSHSPRLITNYIDMELGGDNRRVATPRFTSNQAQFSVSTLSTLEHHPAYCPPARLGAMPLYLTESRATQIHIYVEHILYKQMHRVKFPSRYIRELPLPHFTVLPCTTTYIVMYPYMYERGGFLIS